MAREEDLELARALLEAGILQPEKIDQALKFVDQREVLGIRKSLREVLIELGFVTEKQLEDLENAGAGAPSDQDQVEERPQRSPGVSEPAAADSNIVGGFRLVRPVGQGALGTVWEAEQLSLGKRVAVKILRPDLAQDKQLVERFVREAQAAAKLVHPNIVQAIDAGEDNGTYFFAMEFVEGRNLKDILARHGKLSEAMVLNVARAVAEGLAAAASQGFVHGDIKPANLMLTPDGQLKIADFGLARPFSQSRPIGGTPHYMAPEAVTGEGPVDIRSDLYSLGATMFHLLTGRPPFEGQSVKDILKAHLVQPVPDPRSSRPDISVRTAQIVKKLLAKDPSKRPQSPQVLLDMLARVSSKGTPSKEPRRAEIPRRPARPTRRTAKATRLRKRLPEAEEAEAHEKVAAVRSTSDRTFLYAGLGFGVAISLLVAVMILRNAPREPKKVIEQQLVAEQVKKAQAGMVTAFQTELAEEQKKAREALARIRRNPELSAEERMDAYLRLLKRYAATPIAPQIAQEYDNLRGIGIAGAVDELEQRLARARALLAQGKPYEANEYLNNEFTDSEKLKLGQRFDELINQCVRAIDKIASEAEQKARTLAASSKIEEAKQVLEEARQKVDPQTRQRLLELEAELAGNK